MSGYCDGVRLRITKKALFNEAKQFTKKTRSKRGRQRIQVQGMQGQTGRIRNTDRTTGKGHGTIDDNPTGDKGKTDTIYRGEHRCTTSD